MKYHPETQKHIDFIANKYTENDELETFNIIQLYPLELCYDPEKEHSDGFVDSRFFRVVAFNGNSMERRNFGKHDEIRFFLSDLPIYYVRIFADGSTLIKFTRLAKFPSPFHGSIDIERA